MDRRALWISAVATLLGALALWLYMRRLEQEVSGGPATQVLVLARDAQQGAPVVRELLGERALPEAYLESRHIKARDADQVLGARLGVDVRAGETLLWSDLGGLRDRGRQLSELIPDGMRAIAIELRSGGLDALLNAGDRVDVLSTARRMAPDGSDARAMPVVQNVLVLAVGDDLGGASARRSPRGARSVSLGVTPDQAAQLIEAEQRSVLRVVLRNTADLDITHAEGARDDRAATR
jgi:pilus assembly protein CpaB